MLKNKIALGIISSLLLINTSHASIQEKIDELNVLITQVENKGIDATREKMAISTAELFITFAQWDENNIAKNKTLYDISPFKNDATELSQNLAKFERDSIEEVLDHAIEQITLVNTDVIVRKPVPDIDYTKVDLIDGKLMMDNAPVFINTYTWKPSYNQSADKYFGNLKGAYLSPSHLNENDFSGKSWKINDLTNQNSQEIGDTFIDHNNIPSWAYNKYNDFAVGKRHYGSFDIDNPGAKELYGKMFEVFVPLIKDKRSTELGYMLFNEPSYPTKEGGWNSDVVSDHTKSKFRSWLATQHASINSLNTLWSTNFSNFDAITITIPMNGNLQGTPIWYDWMRFNQIRVKQWFEFLSTEIKKHDTDAKTHIKLMPWLWSENGRDHGMNFEELLEITDIIGFDAQSKYSLIRGTAPWMDDYSFDWQSPIMSFDFFSSIQPDQLLWDSENHFISSVAFAEKDLDTKYLRSIYWLAAIHGLSGSSTWVWSRDEDGGISRNADSSSYIYDVTHQPKALHSIANTFLELNAHGADVVKLQEVDKKIRLFYSETSAINQSSYMASIKDEYNALYFDGIPLGFATQNIINNQENDWSMIVVKDAQRVKLSEITALQNYIDNGGYVLIDNVSLKFDEYGRSHSVSLVNKESRLISYSSETDMQSKVSLLSKQQGILNQLNIIETGNNSNKKIAWRSVKRTEKVHVLSLVNTGKETVSFEIQALDDDKSTTAIDLMTGKLMEGPLSLSPRETYFLEVTLAADTSPTTPAPTTPTTPTTPESNSGSGGSIGLWGLFSLIYLQLMRRQRT
ncbi:beta-galactosidase [Pseudocolwellia agarivorans]|uniref:beta-galactosidase n=1 Tax=Pseudocolwellia agarivorans TaxID=1911682 RepID=UPI000986EDF3|nr:beta-galactosidase [Pseudocolwellia agarivorans]